MPKYADVNESQKQDKLKELPATDDCFVCGRFNPRGLGIRFFADSDGAYAQYVPPVGFQGYDGILHGGILSTLLDEIMVKALAARQITAVTGKLEVRFRKSAPMGDKLFIKGWVVSERKMSFQVAGCIKNEAGGVLCEGKGLFFPA